MYAILRSRDFEASMRRLSRSGIKNSVRQKIENTIDILASGKNLPATYSDHQLSGDLKDFRECHIKSDLLLLYRIEKQNLILVLVDIGSHSQLFG